LFRPPGLEGLSTLVTHRGNGGVLPSVAAELFGTVVTDRSENVLGALNKRGACPAPPGPPFTSPHRAVLNRRMALSTAANIIAIIYVRFSMNDAENIKAKIITWLLAGGLSFDANQDAIGLEVPFLAHRRRADLLVLSGELHALEIKGDSDTLVHLQGQLRDYHKVFDRVSLVTTRRHLQRVYKIISPRTGVILFDSGALRVKRRARINRRLDKRSLLMSLNKSQLNGIPHMRGQPCLGTGEMREMATRRLTSRRVREAVYVLLRDRYRTLFRLFLNDIGDTVLLDDLRTLTGQVKDIFG
jgi:hypothetical protein